MKKNNGMMFPKIRRARQSGKPAIDAYKICCFICGKEKYKPGKEKR